MGVTAFVIGAVVVGGMLLLSKALLKQPSAADAVQEDDFTSPLSTRGVYLPYVIGTAQVAPVFGWVGLRSVTTETLQTSDSGGGKNFGKPSDITELETTVYYEQGWHMLCLGPASALTKIIQDGNEIWSGFISPSDTPSGTTVEVPGQGSFSIFWGEIDQPICPRALQDGIGFASQFPYVCYVFWDKKRLGPNPKWPILNYVLDVSCPREVADVPWDAEVDVTGQGTYQANVASVLTRLLTGKYPHGAGMDPSTLDGDSLESLGLATQSELLGGSFSIDSGDTLKLTLESLLMDIGVAVPYLGDGTLAFNLVREETGTPPSLSLDQVQEEDIETEIRSPQDELETTHVIFEFEDAERNYRINELSFSNDGVALSADVFNSQTAVLKLSNNRQVARRIADRRISEFFGTPPGISMTVLGEAAYFLPGQRFFDPENRMILVLSVEKDPLSASARIEGVIDASGATPEDNGDDGDAGPEPVQAMAREDFAFQVFELPPERYIGSGNTIEIAVVRLRADEAQIGSVIQFEVNGSGNFSSLGVQTRSVAGGPILGTMPNNTTTIVNGPIFEAANDDILTLPDYRNRPTEHEAGALMMLINNEVCYISHVEAQGGGSLWISETYFGENTSIVPANAPVHRRYIAIVGGESGQTEPAWPRNAGETVADGSVVWECRLPLYRLKNILRAKEGTSSQAHIQGDVAYLVTPSNLRPLSAPGFDSGNTIAIKSLPFTSNDTVPASIVEPVEITLSGGAQFGSQEKPFYADHNGDTYVNQRNERYVHDDNAEE